MSFGMNRVELIGRLGADVTVNHLTSGGRVANMSIATDESYIDRNGTGERVDKTEWHRVVTFQDGLIDMLERKRQEGPAGPRRGQAPDPALVEAGRGRRPLLDRDPGRARSQGAVPGQAERGQRQRRGGRGAAGDGARERRGHAGRRRPGAGRRPERGRHHSVLRRPPSHPPSTSGGRFGGRPFFCSRLRAHRRSGLAPALRAARPLSGAGRSPGAGRYRASISRPEESPMPTPCHRAGAAS